MKNAVKTLSNEPVTMSGHLRAVRRDTGKVEIQLDTVTVRYGSHDLPVAPQVLEVIDADIAEDMSDDEILDAWLNSPYGVG